MNEAQFAANRRGDWLRLDEAMSALEHGRRMGRGELREALRLYRRSAADLAVAQTRFPDSGVREELELLVGRAYGAIYRQPERSVGLTGLLLEGLPQAFRKNVGYFAFAFACFTFACILGAVIVTLDERWAELYLPPSAVEGVRQGHLWTNFFRVIPSSVVSTSVFLNNAIVCVSAFALGLALGLGTMYLLFANGLMLGSALSLCWRHGLLGDLAGFVVGHGVLEISAILLAAAGGLMLGDALARPGPYRRADALRLRAREAVPLAVGALPFLAEAAFIEGFISPGGLSHVTKYALGISSGFVMYLYLLTAGRSRAAADEDLTGARAI